MSTSGLAPLLGEAALEPFPSKLPLSFHWAHLPCCLLAGFLAPAHLFVEGALFSVGKLFLKGPDFKKVLALWATVFLSTTQPCLVARKQPERYINQAVPLPSNDILCKSIGSGQMWPVGWAVLTMGLDPTLIPK